MVAAAGAGEAGRGFSVVANEVKELARQTTQPIGEIEQQIADMQSGAVRADTTTEKIFEVVNEVSEVSQSIVAIVEEQSTTINEIARTMSVTSGEAGEVARNVPGSTGALRRVADGAQNELKTL